MIPVKKSLQGLLCLVLCVSFQLCGHVQTVSNVKELDTFIRKNELAAVIFYRAPEKWLLVSKVSKKKPWRGIVYAAMAIDQPEATRVLKRYHLQGDSLLVFKDGVRLATLLMADGVDSDSLTSFFMRHNLDDAIKKVRLERAQRAWLRRQRLDLSGPSSVVMFGANVYPDYVYEGAGDYFGPNYYSVYPRPGHVHFGIGFGF